MFSVLHVIIGILFIIMFVATGLYLKTLFPESNENYDAVRMMYRSSHIYLLLAALVNISFAIYFISFHNKIARNIQRIGSVLVLIAPIALLVAFIYEPVNQSFDRDITFYGILFILTGCVLHGVAKYIEIRLNNNAENNTSQQK